MSSTKERLINMFSFSLWLKLKSNILKYFKLLILILKCIHSAISTLIMSVNSKSSQYLFSLLLTFQKVCVNRYSFGNQHFDFKKGSDTHPKVVATLLDKCLISRLKLLFMFSSKQVRDQAKRFSSFSRKTNQGAKNTLFLTEEEDCKWLWSHLQNSFMQILRGSHWRHQHTIIKKKSRILCEWTIYVAFWELIRCRDTGDAFHCAWLEKRVARHGLNLSL